MRPLLRQFLIGFLALLAPGVCGVASEAVAGCISLADLPHASNWTGAGVSSGKDVSPEEWPTVHPPLFRGSADQTGGANSVGGASNSRPGPSVNPLVATLSAVMTAARGCVSRLERPDGDTPGPLNLGTIFRPPRAHG